MNLEISKWDVSDYLNTKEDITEYLNAILEENDPALFQAALGDVAKSSGMKEIAQSANVGRESLYKSLSSSGNPSYQTIFKVVNSLGLKFQLAPNTN